jgi:hypothetical protein
MKYLNVTRIMLIACFTLAIVSCQDQDIQEDTITNDISEVEEIDLATFNFSNGISLTMSKGYEESKLFVSTMESGANDTKMFIDFKKNSMLKVYLSLTPEGTPVPKALIDLAGSQEKTSSNRKIVERLDYSVFSITEFPVKLMTTTLNVETKAFCDNYPGAEQCYNSFYGMKRYQSSATCKYIQMYTSVFSDSDRSLGAHLTYGKHMTHQNEHTIQPGYWKMYTKVSSFARTRGSYREGFNGQHWKGYTDIN